MSTNNSKKTRIKDIAELAGVSIGTVDRVIHNRGEVSEKTKKKILAIVEKMNFEPDILASTLASKRIIKIGVLLPSVAEDTSFWKSPIEGIELAKNELARYNIQIEYFLFDQFDKKSFVKASDRLLNNQVDAVIMTPLFKSETVNIVTDLDHDNIPYVFINSNIDAQKNLTYIGQDSYQGGFVAGKMTHLAVPQEEPILIVNISSELKNHRHIVKRNLGFTDYFKNVQKDKALISRIDIESTDPHEIYERLAKATSKRVPSGIFVSSSRVFRVAEFIERQKLSSRIYLVGFDLIDTNIHFLEKGVIDLLISQKPVDQGYKSVISLFNHMILHKEVNQKQHLPIDIIIKENIKYYINN